MVYLAVFCGLRKGEILALKRDSFDFDQGLVHVREALTQEDGLKGPKTRSGVRDVPLPPAAVKALEAWFPLCTTDDRGLIFRTKNGTMLADSDFYKWTWHPLLRRAGLEPKGGRGYLHFHALRHYAGSAWLAANVPITDVSSLLGHKNVAITMQVYSHTIVGGHHRGEMLHRVTAQVLPPLALPAPRAVTQEMRTGV
jgi:integrase